MSKKAQQAKKEVAALIEKWAPKMGLTDWDFAIVTTESERPNHRAILAIDPDPAYFRGNIYIYPEFLNSPDSYKEEALVHELCHCLNSEVIKLTGNVLDGKMVTQENFTDAVERLTQRMTKLVLNRRPRRHVLRDK